MATVGLRTPCRRHKKTLPEARTSTNAAALGHGRSVHDRVLSARIVSSTAPAPLSLGLRSQETIDGADLAQPTMLQGCCAGMRMNASRPGRGIIPCCRRQLDPATGVTRQAVQEP